NSRAAAREFPAPWSAARQMRGFGVRPGRARTCTAGHRLITEEIEMRPQSMKHVPHAGVMLVIGFVALSAAGAGAFGHPSRSAAAPTAAAPAARDGAALFKTYCAACHGEAATGAGPAAIAMKVAPPNLTKIAARNGGKFPDERVRQIVLGKGPAAHGERNMPVWGDVFARKEPGV